MRDFYLPNGSIAQSRFKSGVARVFEKRQESRNSRLTARISLILIFLCSLAFLYTLFYGSVASQFRMGGAIIVCLIAYFLNWTGRYTAARCIICLIPVVSSLILPLIYGDVKPVALFWYPLAAMGYSLLPYVFFDVEKERKMFWLMFSLHLMVVVYIPVFVHTGKYSTTETREYLCSPSFRAAYTLIYLLINLSVLALVRVNKYYENQIYAMNNSLEKIIEKRTMELMERNVQLSQYAFLNSHKVRGPLARILGLLTLWKENITNEEREEIHFKMDHAAHELDEVVSEMNRKLNE